MLKKWERGEDCYLGRDKYRSMYNIYKAETIEPWSKSAIGVNWNSFSLQVKQ